MTLRLTKVLVVCKETCADWWAGMMKTLPPTKTGEV